MVPAEQVNANVSDERLWSLRRDGFTAVYADIGERLEAADQPESWSQRRRLRRLAGDRLQGVQFDIEPYVDPDFWDNVKGSLQAYLLTVEGIVDACGIVIGQEFTEVTPTKLSFWWVGRAAFRQAAEELTAAYGGLPQFRGLSVDDMDACQEVGEDPRRW